MSAETKTCTKCGKAKRLGEFGKYRSDGPTLRAECRACGVARAAESERNRKASDRAAVLAKQSVYKKRYEARNRELIRARHRDTAATRRAEDPETARARVREQTALFQAETRAKAMHNGKQWTGPELELVADSSRSAREVALALGRTYGAVARMRHKIRFDPRKARMAGTDVEKAS